MATLNQALIEKLRKVLALTNSPVENEAQAAAATLQRILAEHNLTIADLESKGQNAPKVLQSPFDLGKAAFNWKLDLAEAIAEHYYCHAIVDRTRKTVHFVGRPDNVESLKMLYGWIVDQIKRLAAEDREQHKTENGEHIDPLRWQVNYGVGAVERLGRRLREQREKEQADVRSTAIVVHHQTEISDYLEEAGHRRIDGQMTKYERDYQARRDAELKADAELLANDPGAYYEKYPWRHPDALAEAEKQREKDIKEWEKREARNARRRTGRRVRYMTDAERRHEEEAGTARRAGTRGADRVNLQPFIGNGDDSTSDSKPQLSRERKALKG